MPPKINFELKGRILAHWSEGYSHSKIVKKLSENGTPVFLIIVRRVIFRQKDKENGLTTPVKKLPDHMKPRVRSKALIRKVASVIKSPNLPSQHSMSRKLGIAIGTVNNILKKDLKVKLRKKTKTHMLTAKQAQQRLDRAPGFLEYLTPRKLKYIITFDETTVSSNDIDGQTNFYYQFEGQVVPESWRKMPKSSWPKQLMVAIGICYRGKTKVYIVPPKSKVNARFFIDNILKPIVEKDIPRLYPGEEHKVVIHMDSAPAHVAKETYQWFDERGIKYIPKDKWPANSCDLSSMDYAVNSIFKGIISRRKADGLYRLQRIVKQEWDKFPMGIIQRTIDSWPKRVQMMAEQKGFQYEHLLKN